MLGTFLGLETATRGLEAEQAAIEVTAHNIDNANTPGYSRQRADLTTSVPIEWAGFASATSNFVGTGVQVDKITRLRDAFLDSQYRNQNQLSGQWDIKQGTLQNVTAIFNEPSDTGISSAVKAFWNAWGKLGPDSNNPSAREQVIAAGQTLTNTLSQTAKELDSLQSNLQSSIGDKVTSVNSYLKQIASVNGQIDAAQVTGGQSPDLMDQRDTLVDSLSRLTDVQVTQTGSTYQLSIGGQTVLTDSTVQMNLSTSASSATQLNVSQVTGGELRGLRDSLGIVQDYHTNLDTLASSLATGAMNVKLAGDWGVAGSPSGTAPVFPVSGTFADGTPFVQGNPVTPAQYPNEGITLATLNGVQVATIPAGATVAVNGLNGLQHLGFSETGQGGDFFTSSVVGQPINAENIQVGSSVQGIAAGMRPVADPSGTGLVAMSGDGTLAMTTDSMKDTSTSFPDPSNPTQSMTGTLDEYFQAVVGKLGVQSQEANQESQNQQGLVQQVDTQRQAVSGVSIDEEMANMIKYQQAYNASARLVATIGQMLDTLINHTGVGQ